MKCPWYISARAVREWAALRGANAIPDDGPEWDRFENELMSIAIDAAERKSPKRTESGMLIYRVRKPIDAQLHVSDAYRPEGKLPQLVRVVDGYRGHRRVM